MVTCMNWLDCFSLSIEALRSITPAFGPTMSAFAYFGHFLTATNEFNIQIISMSFEIEHFVKHAWAVA
jgi:hypothetical protein